MVVEGHRFVRYADDFIILVKSRSSGERVMRSVQRFLERKLKLQVNEDAFHEFKRRVKRLILSPGQAGRSWSVSMDYRLKKLAEYVRGWMNYFGISEYYDPIPEIDPWLRHRIRLCHWKQWRYRRTRIRELVKLGIPLSVAVPVCVSNKGLWRTFGSFTGNHVGLDQLMDERSGIFDVCQRTVGKHSLLPLRVLAST